MYKKIIMFLAIVASFVSCSKNNGENREIIEKKNIPINASERARAEVDKGGGLNDAIFGRGKGATTYEFSTSNVLWRASIGLLQDIPLANVDYAGGVIITDWYTNDGKESIKININFSSNDLSVSSININSFKKLCTTENNCQVQKMDTSFSSSLKEKIIAKARELEINRIKNKEK